MTLTSRRPRWSPRSPYDDRAALRWHDLLPLRDKVDQKTRPVDEDYLLVFGDAPAPVGGRTCNTGFTDFDRRRCWVNAECLPDISPEEQFIVTVFIAAHERAHARWTEFVEADFHRTADDGTVLVHNGQPLFDMGLHQCWNILEDERIERLLGRDFPHLHDYLRDGSSLLLALMPQVLPTNDPMEVLKWVLRRRVFTRAGLDEECPLSAENRALLDQIEPLLADAFACHSSRRVVELARAVLKILQLDGGSMGNMTVLSGMLGQRQGSDHAVADGASEDDGELEVVEGRAEQEADAILQAAGYSPGTWNRAKITPAPYDDLVASVRPYSAQLLQLFRQPPAQRRTEYERTGARLSVRAAVRTPGTPFRTDGEVSLPGAVALTLVIDDSGSMGGEPELQGRRTAMMCREALPSPHRVRVVLAPSGRIACAPEMGEMSRAFIAGYNSPSGTAYAPALKQELDGLLTLDSRYTRYLVLIADGLSGDTDQKECVKIRKFALRKGVRMFGIGLGLSEGGGDAFYKNLFGDQYLSIHKADELVERMSGILTRIGRQVKARHG